MESPQAADHGTPTRRLVHVGFGNSVAAHRIVVVAASDSAPIRRLVQTARESSQVIDVTFGHRTKCVLVLDTGQVVLAALSARAIARRVGLSREEDGPW